MLEALDFGENETDFWDGSPSDEQIRTFVESIIFG